MPRVMPGMNPVTGAPFGRVLRLTVLMAAVVLVSGCASVPWRTAASPSADRPNVLFILTDDLRYDALGAYGNEVVRTPHIDALARQGMQFNRFYVASPVCHPSRASFLTGRYPHQPGIEKRYVGYGIQQGLPTVATRLNEAGYVTGFIGKAHPHGTPYDWGFDHSPVRSVDRENWKRDIREEGRVFRVRSPFRPEGERRVVRGPTTKFLVNHGVRFLREHREDPWFLWFATHSPHTPYFYDEDHPYDLPEDYTPPGYVRPESETPFEAYPEGGDRLRTWVDTLWRNYYSEISQLDRQLGRLLRILKETGQARDTLVVLTSDNGIMHGSHGIAFKSIWYEEATRVPAIVRWPDRVPAGTRTDALVSSVDFLPTVLDAVDSPVRSDLTGRSALPVLRDPETTIRSHVFSTASRLNRHGGGRWFIVRDDRYKYVTLRDREERFLYDLRRDPFERYNLIRVPRLERTRRNLRKTLENWTNRTRSNSLAR